MGLTPGEETEQGGEVQEMGEELEEMGMLFPSCQLATIFQYLFVYKAKRTSYDLCLWVIAVNTK